MTKYVTLHDDQQPRKQSICILGSTGSIGTQALDVIAQHPDRYEVYCLTANNSVEKLAAQARQFNPAAVVIANEHHYEDLQAALSDRPDIKVYAGKKALEEIVTAGPIDTVLASVAQYHVSLLPVDSEHSAIFQCLVGEDRNEVDKILLTCSGGPFRLYTHEQLEHVTAADALKHPTWDMGAKITIDSASLMNKGFEVMEAKWLFGVPADKIQVLIHPQSIVHSGVQFMDGAVKAQLGVPDMRLPIQYAFSFPERLSLNGERLDLFKAQKLEFFEPDTKKFECLALAYEAIHQGGNMPCILNAANEVANAAFRQGRCSFLGMAEVIRKTMEQATFDKNPDLDIYLQTDKEAREIARQFLEGAL